MPDEQIFFEKLHQVFCISMKFSTFVDLTDRLNMQRNFFKNYHYLWSYHHLKNAIYPRYAPINILTFILHS